MWYNFIESSSGLTKIFLRESSNEIFFVSGFWRNCGEKVRVKWILEEHTALTCHESF
jgi:hypothetical protein